MREPLRATWKAWWPAVKALLGLAILALIARQFAADLARPELWARPLQPGWFVASGLLYLAGLAVSAFYWGRLLSHVGYPAPALPVARAYFVGHLGKYVPGKALALVLRATLLRPAGVPLGVSGVTGFYEVLSGMCGGVLLAALLFALVGTGADHGGSPAGAEAPSWGALRQVARLQVPERGVLGRPEAVALALILAAATGLPLVPRLFNRLAQRILRRFHTPAQRMPHIRPTGLLQGLGLALPSWLLLGASLGCALRGVAGPLDWPPEALARLPAALAVAYVAGFVMLLAPGGLGVREFFLALLLAPEVAALGRHEPDEARALVVLTVLVLRLSWTAAELALAALLYFLPAAIPTPAPPLPHPGEPQP